MFDLTKLGSTAEIQQNTEENRHEKEQIRYNSKAEKKILNPKILFKMRRKSLSPFSRVQNLIDENEKDK